MYGVVCLPWVSFEGAARQQIIFKLGNQPMQTQGLRFGFTSKMKTMRTVILWAVAAFSSKGFDLSFALRFLKIAFSIANFLQFHGLIPNQPDHFCAHFFLLIGSHINYTPTWPCPNLEPSTKVNFQSGGNQGVSTHGFLVGLQFRWTLRSSSNTDSLRLGLPMMVSCFVLKGKTTDLDRHRRAH